VVAAQAPTTYVRPTIHEKGISLKCYLSIVPFELKVKLTEMEK